MSLIGLCNICGKPGSMFTCVLCGRLVCSNCCDAGSRVCISCKSGKL